MIFTTYEFAIFFAVVLLVRSQIRSFAVDKWFLLIASYLFYMSWSVPCASIILFTSVVDFLVGAGLEKITVPSKRRLLLTASVVVNLSVLAFFKYTNFLLANVGWGLGLLGFHVPELRYDIILPVGVSFFTFQNMTYTIETYRGNIKACHSLRDFLLFGAFFPQLLAGPINRAADLLPQFQQQVRASASDFETGLLQFALGAAKKLVISDQIAPHVDLIFSNPGGFDGLALLQGVIGYGLQIYCDFSGYSDMAIGCARMMGFTFKENFQMPYSSTTITEFWRRWHISLSSWFRDYLYIPLGGNRAGEVRTYVNLLTTMLLCGLWHGASWNFIFWGGFHGVCLALHRIWQAWDPLRGWEKIPGFAFVWQVFSRVLTISIVLVGWIFFRAQTWDAATEFLHRIVTWNPEGTRFFSPYILPALVAVFLIHVVINKDRNWTHEVVQKSMPMRIGAFASLLLLIVCLGATNAAPFIYFQF